ncbi:MAG TPA: type IV toxin-antitoxin system AbiEi family antitoxin domain-containing protein [Bacteroidia bacterium]|nr:type IV toxin-antitoxin system AbiEi family antitoxin domain-containing protein [Bacteroidia bacterium]
MATNLIKSLQIVEPRGAPLDSATLRGHGISSALAHDYVKSGWLERLGRGVFLFAGDRLERDATLCFLERRMPGLHVAARTALAWHGFRQNVAHRESLVLWGSRKGPLPSWFVERFPARYSAPRLFDDDLPAGWGLAPLAESPDGPMVSSPERALLEMLSEVGVHQAVEEARGIMESVRQIRSRQLAKLLSHCRMAKAIRLCVAWAEELGLPWAEQAREAAAHRTGGSRWIRRLADGHTLILKP